MDNYEQRYVIDMITSQMERTIRRLWILCIILTALLVGSNIAWLVYESQYETVAQVATTNQEVQQENDSGDNIMVGGNYGKADN